MESRVTYALFFITIKHLITNCCLCALNHKYDVCLMNVTSMCGCDIPYRALAHSIKFYVSQEQVMAQITMTTWVLICISTMGIAVASMTFVEMFDMLFLQY